MNILNVPVGTRQSRFWDWFCANEAMLLDFEHDQMRAFKELSTALSRVHHDLVFEVGPVEGGRRELVISAGGRRTLFPEVEKLVASAPQLSRWRIIKFRPRRYTEGRIVLGDVAVETNQVYWVAEPMGAKTGVILFLPHYAPTPRSLYEQIGFLLLDQALGEFDVETKIGYIEFAVLPSPIPSELRRLDELSRLIDGSAVS